MAAPPLPEFLSEQEWNPIGHTTRFKETLHFFQSRLPLVFEKSFTFQCERNPTSWSIRLVFRRVLTDGSVTCEVTVRRLDSTPVDMGTDFWMRPILHFQYPDLSTLNLRADGMLPKHRGSRMIQFVPYEALERWGNLPLQVEMFFRIRRCHGSLAAALGDFEERFPPPTEFEYMLVSFHPRDP